MSRPTHFEIFADDPARAMDFYQIVLGWTFEQHGNREYWLIKTGDESKPGINGGLLPRKGPTPVEGQAVPVVGYICTMEVRDLATMLQAVDNAGGKLVKPRQAIPGVGWLVFCTDTEGNIFGLMQPDATAA